MLVFAVAWAFCAIRRGITAIEQRSGLEAPVRMALHEIQNDLKNGNVSDAEKKLQLLQNAWQDYFDSGNHYPLGNILVDFNKTAGAEQNTGSVTNQIKEHGRQ